MTLAGLLKMCENAVTGTAKWPNTYASLQKYLITAEVLN